MPGIRAVSLTPEQQQRYRQMGQIAAYDDPELGPILRGARVVAYQLATSNDEMLELVKAVHPTRFDDNDAVSRSAAEKLSARDWGGMEIDWFRAEAYHLKREFQALITRRSEAA